MKLFSIKEEFSEKIFKREKLVEFRRQNVNIKEKEVCLIYTTSPVKKITGYFIVERKIRTTINQLWIMTRRLAGITRREFFNYFKGCKEGTAILIKSVKRFGRGLELKEIKNNNHNFVPPQSYYNLESGFLLYITKYYGVKYGRIGI